MNQILVYSTFESERLHYILNLLLKEQLGLDWVLTQSLHEASTSLNPVIYYADIELENGFVITPFFTFLNAHDLAEVDPNPQKTDRTIELFSTKKGVLGFDIFAASFYLVSRYEEYQVFNPDAHGRFAAIESLAWRYGFLDRPLVNEWVDMLAQKLVHHFPNLEINKPRYSHLVTVDVDAVFSYRCKGFMRSLGGLARDIFKGNVVDVKDRLLTLVHWRTDPYDVYEEMIEVANQSGKTIQWFVLAACYADPDNSNMLTSKAVKNKIKMLSLNGKLGIHPSYLSNKKPELLVSELHYLNDLSLSTIHQSRQHFLMLQMPKTYRNLIEKGISEDYSMGYADKPGFRASIASPFYFFDLLENKTTTLRVYPLIIMDRTFVSYEGYTPELALIEMNRLREIVKRNNGMFISLWHNIILANTTEGQKWMMLYKKFLQEDEN